MFLGGTQIRTGEWRICNPLPYHLAIPPYKYLMKAFEPFGTYLHKKLLFVNLPKRAFSVDNIIKSVKTIQLENEFSLPL